MEIPRCIKPGPLFCRIALKLLKFYLLNSHSQGCQELIGPDVAAETGPRSTTTPLTTLGVAGWLDHGLAADAAWTVDNTRNSVVTCRRIASRHASMRPHRQLRHHRSSSFLILQHRICIVAVVVGVFCSVMTVDRSLQRIALTLSSCLPPKIQFTV